MAQLEHKMRTHFHPELAYRFSWFQLVRPMTFTGTISPILAGTAFSALHGSFQLDIFIIMIIAALLVQSSANIFNDYYDCKHGQDHEKWSNEIYSNSGVTPTIKVIPYVALGLIGIAVILGIWLSVQSSWWVALIGAISILAGYGYSAGNHSFSALGLGELIAAIFLGFVTTVLAAVVQGYELDSTLFMFATSFALLISTMILTNNIRDIKKDRGFRQTIAIRLGRKKAVLLLRSLLTINYVWITLLVLLETIPWFSILVILSSPFAYRLSWSYRQNATRKEELEGMKWAAKHHWAFGLLLATGVWMGSFL